MQQPRSGSGERERRKALHGQGRLLRVWASEPDAVSTKRGRLVNEPGLRTGGAAVIDINREPSVLRTEGTPLTSISGRALSRTVTAWRSTRW
jgi:hypothetical protein